MNSSKKSPLFIAGIAFSSGVLFLLIFILLDLFLVRVDHSFTGVLMAHFKSPSYWFLYFLPFFAGIIAWKISQIYNKQFETIDSQIANEQLKTQKVHNYVQSLLGASTTEEIILDMKNDPLAKSLIALKENIAKNKEEEIIRRKEDEERRWVSEGLAMFGEILRNNHDNLNELSYNIVSNLVKYTNSNQGAIFILNDDVEYNKFFDMTACYAYERRKFADGKIDFGEGLIGTCALEKQTIYLSEIPDSYLNITSGLGMATPKSLLLVPLNINEENCGVIEIASFDEYSRHQIEFIEKIAESVASTISGVKVNIKTAKLLQESREQAEIMTSQEEEMRQNMEELQATQEEAARQSERFVSFSNSVNSSLMKAEYDLNGNLLTANDNFMKRLGYSSESEIKGKDIKMFINPIDKDWFDAEWIKIVRGREIYEGEIKHLTKAGKDLFMMATFSQIYGKHNELENILFLAIDSSDIRNQLAEFEGQLFSFDKTYPRALFGIDGSLIEINQVFCNLLELEKEELQNKTIFDLISPDEKESFQSTWENISSGSFFNGQIKILSKKGSEKWLAVNFGNLHDLEGEITRIVMLGNDLSREKELETVLANRTEMLAEKDSSLKQLREELKLRKKQAGL